MVTWKETWRKIKESVFRKDMKMKVHAQDTVAWTIIGRDLKLTRLADMYNGYTIRYKYRFFRPFVHVAVYLFLKLNKKVLGKALIPPEKVSKEPCNKLINIVTATFDQTLRESSLILKKDLKGWKNPLSRGYNKFLKDGYDIFLQTILYDTYYRTFFEMLMFNIAINIGEAYKKDKTHILYTKSKLDNIDYLMATTRNFDDNLIFIDPLGAVIVPKGNAIRLENQGIDELIEKLEAQKKKQKEQEKLNKKEMTAKLKK